MASGHKRRSSDARFLIATADQPRARRTISTMCHRLDRQPRDVHAERAQRIVDRRGDRRRDRKRATLARALCAERIERRRRLHVMQLDPRQAHRRGQHILRVIHRQRLAIPVVDHLLQQGRAERLNQRAHDLPFDDPRIDDATAIVHHDVAQHLHGPRRDIDLHLRCVRAIVVCHRGWHEIDGRLETRRRALRQSETWWRGQRAGDLAVAQRPCGIASRAKHASHDLDVLRRAVEDRRRRGQRLVAHLARGLLHGGPTHRRLAAGERAEPERRQRRVAANDAHLLHRHIERIGCDLSERGRDALALRGRTRGDQHAARRPDAHQRAFERPAPRAFDVVCDPNTDVAALRTRQRLPLGEPGITRGLEHHRLRTGIIAAVVGHDAAVARSERRGVRHLIRPDQIAAPHLRAIETELRRDRIHRPLHRERRPEGGRPRASASPASCWSAPPMP